MMLRRALPLTIPVIITFITWGGLLAEWLTEGTVPSHHHTTLLVLGGIAPLCAVLVYCTRKLIYELRNQVAHIEQVAAKISFSLGVESDRISRRAAGGGDTGPFRVVG